jgi:FkbM family methyltransferase
MIILKKILFIVLKNIFNVVGYDIIRLRKTFNEIYKKNVNNNAIIFDVGANEGQSIKRFTSVFPRSTIHSFEPIQDCYKKLIKIFNKKNIIINNIALGEKECERTFFINKNSYTSSFLKINDKYNELVNFDRVKKTESKKITTLDKYVKLHSINKIDILKIDTQGYELNILRGAKKSLNGIIKFIEIEITVADYYNKKINIYEIDKLLVKNNYILCNITNLEYDKNNYLSWFDLLYRKNSFK